MKNQKIYHGFTLAELMIVIAILGILAAVAIPSYKRSVESTGRSDGRGALLEAYARQESYYLQTLGYLNNSGLDKLVTNSDGKSSAKGNYELKVTIPGGCTSGTKYTCYEITATAVGTQASDTTCATLSIDNLGDQTSTGGGNCWME